MRESDEKILCVRLWIQLYGINNNNKWAIPFEIHTPPVKNLPQAFHRGSINSKWIKGNGQKPAVIARGASQLI